MKNLNKNMNCSEMEDLILRKPSVSEMRKIAEKKRMVSMYKDGLIKVIEKITTIEEVKRVAMER